jgi:predicted lipoprotein with Yx(FWY)xxD motif
MAVRRASRDRYWFTAVGAIAAGLLLAACGSSSGGGSSPGAAGTTPPASTASGGVVGTASTPVGTILVNGQGMALYVFGADSPGHSNCTGSCLTYWPPAPAPASMATAGSGVSAKLGVLKRSDGTNQLTVNGWPVYTYVGDSTPGAITGQGTNLSGGVWWVVSPSGAQITTTSGASGSSTPSPSSSATTSSGGGWG